MVAVSCQRCPWKGSVETVVNSSVFNCPDCGGITYRIVPSDDWENRA